VSPRARAFLANVALAAVSVVLAATLLELALRVIGVRSERQTATRRMVDARWTRLLDCYPSNPRGYFDIDLRRPENRSAYSAVAPRRFEAIARDHPWAVLSEYNHLRFREVVPGPRAAGARRVVVFGDSFSEGQGVKEKDTLARVLETRLNAAGAGRWELRNCGRRGLDFPQLLEGFEASLQYEPDLLVYALVLNDAERPPEFQARQSYVNDWILDRERLPEETTTPPRWRPRLFDLVADRYTAWRVGRETTRWYLDMWSDANPGWARTQQHLLEMDRRLREQGARLLVTPWPLFVGLESGYPFERVHETLRAFCAGHGIAFHDLLPAFRGRRSEALWVHAVDRHPNEIAHRLAAESLEADVRRLVVGP
jgi:lysophospholipase L1-like esterase